MTKPTGKPKGRPKKDPRLVASAVIPFKGRIVDIAALIVLGEKKHMDRANILREGLHRLVDFEGLREQVELKANLLAGGAVSSAG